MRRYIGRQHADREEPDRNGHPGGDVVRQQVPPRGIERIAVDTPSGVERLRIPGVAVVEHAAAPETTAAVSPPTKPLSEYVSGGFA